MVFALKVQRIKNNEDLKEEKGLFKQVCIEELNESTKAKNEDHKSDY